MKPHGKYKQVFSTRKNGGKRCSLIFALFARCSALIVPTFDAPEALDIFERTMSKKHSLDLAAASPRNTVSGNRASRFPHRSIDRIFRFHSARRFQVTVEIDRPACQANDYVFSRIDSTFIALIKAHRRNVIGLNTGHVTATRAPQRPHCRSRNVRKRAGIKHVNVSMSALGLHCVTLPARQFEITKARNPRARARRPLHSDMRARYGLRPRDR